MTVTQCTQRPREFTYALIPLVPECCHAQVIAYPECECTDKGRGNKDTYGHVGICVLLNAHILHDLLLRLKIVL